MLISLADALIEALDDEYKARATYRYVIDTFGPIRPFSNIVNAETRHIEALLPLFHKYRIPVPPDTWDQRITKPQSIEDACTAGVTAEIENVEMYNRLLKATVDYPDVQGVMINLQRASAEHHLPAFQRCVIRFSRQYAHVEDQPHKRQQGRRRGGCGGRRRHRSCRR
ncbi:MAG: DUF2202 domain-containing protein [Desulfobulbus propionicus]|nr:MAG: DUF2202 domain-containing protein [Desulfobulbus propionicus]